ncbi:MAG TPA: hypothetical protein DCZ11_05340 [Gammaproteobacteria bacterium]|nr:hypothetical protein [Gammaproteobacteria bacterium]MCH77846.1 hypothetical protein [Gammaproteobacteria bacterium]
MSRIGDATLDLVRDRDTVTLDWILAELTRRCAHGRRLDVAWATGEIHLALVNAGWHHDCHDSPAGNPVHCYQRRPSIHQSAASGGQGEHQ